MDNDPQLLEHNLRTPFAILNGYLSLLEAGEVPFEAALPPMRRAVDRLHEHLLSIVGRR